MRKLTYKFLWLILAGTFFDTGLIAMSACCRRYKKRIAISATATTSYVGCAYGSIYYADRDEAAQTACITAGVLSLAVLAVAACMYPAPCASQQVAPASTPVHGLIRIMPQHEQP